MKEKFYKLNWKTALIIYILIDIILVGAGMGVPIFPIFFGIFIGIWAVKRSILLKQDVYQKTLKTALITSSITFIIMILIWGRAIFLSFNKNFNFANFGNPLILFDPKLSFIAWLILMIIISPVLQMLTSIFFSFLTIYKNRKHKYL